MESSIVATPDPLPPSTVPDGRTPESRWARPWWYGLCLAALGATFFWAQRVVSDDSMDEQRALVPVSTVWGMHACLVLGIAGFAGVVAPLARLLGRRHLLTGLGLAVLGYGAVGLAPETNRIYFDEHIYMQVAQTLAHTGRAEYANYARAEYGQFSVYEAWVNKQPNGHPYLLSWPFRIFGASEGVAQTTVRVVVALTAALLYFALVLAPWTLPPAAPLAVAIVFLFTPLVPWWGHTVAVEPTTAATAAVVFFAACLHARWRDPVTGQGFPATGAVLAATAAFAAYFRPESLLVYPVAAALLWAADRRFLEDRTTWAALALSLALLAPNLLHLWSVRMEDWGATDGRRFGVEFLTKNFQSNAGYFVQGRLFPLAGTALGLIGAGWLAVRSRRFVLAAALWFVLSWGIFILFYAGGYYYGASDRYAVVSAAPVAVFVGIGAAALFTGLRRHPALLGAVGAAIVLNWASAMHFVPTPGREATEARADVDFARAMAAKLPTGSLVISPDPCLWNLLGRNASQMPTVHNMVRTEMRELVRQYPGGIYLHWDYWVNSNQPRMAEVWKKLIIDSHATIFGRGAAEAYKFALFRLDTPYARETMGGQAKIEGPQPDLDEVAAEALAGRPAAAAPEAAATQPETAPQGRTTP
jgi:hypothetical protein